MNTTTEALVIGYRGQKIHAVDSTTMRNQVLAQAGEAISLCGWNVQVSELPFTDNGLACRNCAKAAQR